MDLVLEDKASVGRMVYHPMKEAVVGVNSASNFVRAPNFGKLKLITLEEHVKNCHHLFIFKGVHLRREFGFLVVASVAPLLLWWSFP